MSELMNDDAPAITRVYCAGSGTLLTREAIELGRLRIATGESLDYVAADLARQEVDMLMSSIEAEVELRAP